MTSETHDSSGHSPTSADQTRMSTIVSLDCLLNLLTKGRPNDQTPAKWELAVKHRLKPPEVTLRSYGGGGLIVGQIQANLQCGPYRQTAVVLVQNGALEELLLGTNLQPQLGFHYTPDNSDTETRNEEQPVPVVRLLQTERLPAHYGHLVRAHVDPQIGKAKQLFVPLCDSLEQSWEAEEGLIELKDDHTTTLILCNPTDIPFI